MTASMQIPPDRILAMQQIAQAAQDPQAKAKAQLQLHMALCSMPENCTPPEARLSMGEKIWAGVKGFGKRLVTGLPGSIISSALIVSTAYALGGGGLFGLDAKMGWSAVIPKVAQLGALASVIYGSSGISDGIQAARHEKLLAYINQNHGGAVVASQDRGPSLQQSLGLGMEQTIAHGLTGAAAKASHIGIPIG